MRCFHPQTFNGNVVACGRCPACKANRVSGWLVRIDKHARSQHCAHFVTLTYSPDFIPKSPNKLYTLDYSHVQLFFKTLRNFHHEKNIARGLTYYVAGEYGSRTQRPHYHIILFNSELDLLHKAWRVGTSQGWCERGSVHSGTVSGAAIRYCLKYINKPGRVPLFRGDDRQKEFGHMSKGIGASYLTPQMIAWHRADLLNRYYVPMQGGMKFPMPRYYSNRIYTDAERIIIGEHLEKVGSEAFYKQVIGNDDFVDNYLKALEYQEYKHSLGKQYKL